MAAGRGILGFMLVGKGLRFFPGELLFLPLPSRRSSFEICLLVYSSTSLSISEGIRLIGGFTKEDIVWSEVQKGSKTGRARMAGFWALVVLISVACAAASKSTIYL